MKCELKYIKYEFKETTKRIFSKKISIIMLILFVIFFNLCNYITKSIFDSNIILYIGYTFIIIVLLIIYIDAKNYCKNRRID